jgi:hypothetical protein
MLINGLPKKTIPVDIKDSMINCTLPILVNNFVKASLLSEPATNRCILGIKTLDTVDAIDV